MLNLKNSLTHAHIIFALIFFACMLFFINFSLGLNDISYGLLLNVLALIDYIGLLFLFYRMEKKLFLFVSFALFHHFTFILGVISLEYNGYSNELGWSPPYSGSATELVLFFSFFYFSLIFLKRSVCYYTKTNFNFNFNLVKLKSTRLNRSLILLFSFGLILASLFLFISYNTAFSYNFDRISFWRAIDSYWLFYFIKPEYFVLLIPLFTILLAVEFNDLFFGRLIPMTLMIIMVCCGEKLSGFVVFFFGFMSYATTSLNLKIKDVLGSKYFIVGALFSTCIIFIYLNQQVNAYQSLSNRMSLQGQISSSTSFINEKIGQEPLGIYAFTSNEILNSTSREPCVHGMSLLVCTLAQPDYVKKHIAEGGGFADGFPAILREYFGSNYFLYSIFIAIIIILIYFFYYFILAQTPSLLHVILMWVIWLPINISLVNGDLYLLIPSQTKIILVGLIVLLLPLYHINKRNIHA